MKTQTALKPARIAALLAAMTAASLTPGFAATLYWDGETSADWNALTNWSTASDATTPNPAAVPTAADDVVFNISTLNANVATTANSSMSANSLTFNNTGTSRISSNSSTSRDFLLGAGGITANSGAGTVNLGNTSATVRFGITASQAWTNHSTSNIVLQNAGGAANTGTGAVTLTISNTSTGQMSFNNALQDGTAGRVLSLVINSSGTGATNLATNSNHSYSGGTTIQRGIFQSSSYVIGTGNVTIDAATNNTATLRLNVGTYTTGTAPNQIITNHPVNNTLIAGASGGTNHLEFVHASNSINYSGDIILNGNLNVGVRNITGGATLSGDITGNGSLIKGQYQATNSVGLLTIAGDAAHRGNTTINNGAFTLAEAGSLTFYIGANGVSNQVNGTTAGLVTFNGSFNFNFSNADASEGNSWELVTVSNKAYGDNFSISGFSYDESENLWVNGGWAFDQSSGILTYAIPEPEKLSP